VLVRAGRSFGMDLHYMKSHFYSSFNSIVHRSKNSHDELVILHLVSAYCKPYLLYSTDYMLVFLSLNYVALSTRGNVQFHVSYNGC